MGGGDADPHINLPKANEDRELTPQEQKELERREKAVRFYYADPALTEEMKSPERIYDFLYNLLPKCPKCGSVGKYKKPNKSGKSRSCGSSGYNRRLVKVGKTSLSNVANSPSV